MFLFIIHSLFFILHRFCRPFQIPHSTFHIYIGTSTFSSSPQGSTSASKAPVPEGCV